MDVRTDFAGYLPLLTEKDDETGRRILQRAYKIIIDHRMAVIPQGFDTDFSSLPFGTRNLVRFDKVDVAGVVHDYLYRTGTVPRKRADQVWKAVALHGNGANRFQANVAYLGLRIGGWKRWNFLRKSERPLVSV